MLIKQQLISLLYGVTFTTLFSSFILQPYASLHQCTTNTSQLFWLKCKHNTQLGTHNLTVAIIWKSDHSYKLTTLSHGHKTTKAPNHYSLQNMWQWGKKLNCPSGHEGRSIPLIVWLEYMNACLLFVLRIIFHLQTVFWHQEYENTMAMNRAQSVCSSLT